MTARAYLTILSGDGASGMALLDRRCRSGGPSAIRAAWAWRSSFAVWRSPGRPQTYRQAVPTFAESLALARQRGPRWTAYFCLYCMGEAARLEGDLQRADVLLERVPVALLSRA